MKEVLETHSQHFTHLWEGVIGSKQTPRLEPLSRAKQCNAECLCLVFALSTLRTNSICYNAAHPIISTLLTLLRYVSSLSEMEQLLYRCSAFIYLGMERFMANIPPAKLAALNLSGTVHSYMVFSRSWKHFYLSECMLFLKWCVEMSALKNCSTLTISIWIPLHMTFQFVHTDMHT